MALEGDGVSDTIDLLFELRDQSSKQISTADLNAALHDASVRLVPRSRGKVPKLYYATQTGTMPLSLLVFVNEPKLFRGQYERYLSNLLRERFDVPEIPLKISFRKRERSEPGGPGASAGD